MFGIRIQRNKPADGKGGRKQPRLARLPKPVKQPEQAATAAPAAPAAAAAPIAAPAPAPEIATAPDSAPNSSSDSGPAVEPAQEAVNPWHQERRVRAVTAIVKAWETAGVSVECELCQQPDWSLVAADGADGIALPFSHAAKVDLTTCFLVYAVECKNCGNIRTISRSRVEELAGSDHTAHR